LGGKPVDKLWPNKKNPYKSTNIKKTKNKVREKPNKTTT
jgi:hypothetical protein